MSSLSRSVVGFLGFGGIAHGEVFDGSMYVRLPLNHLDVYVAQGVRDIVIYDLYVSNTIKTQIQLRFGNVRFRYPADLSEFLSIPYRCVSICSPTEYHGEHLALLLSNGYQTDAIWMEKPAWHDCSFEADLKNMLFDQPLPIHVGYWRPFLPEYNELRKQIKSRQIRPVAVRGVYSRDFLSNGSHLIDLIDYLFGDLEMVGGRRLSVETLSLFGRVGEVEWSITALSNVFFNKFELEIFCQSEVIRLERNGRIISKLVPIPDPDFPHLDIIDDKRIDIPVSWNNAFGNIFLDLINPKNDVRYWRKCLIRQFKVGEVLKKAMEIV